MKIALIGNSHLAALKLAWDELQHDYQQTKLELFGAPADLMSNLQAQDGALIPTDERTKKNLQLTSQGLDKIDFNEYDVVLLHGLRSRISDLGNALATYQIYDSGTQQQRIISSACFTQLCRDQVRYSLMFQVASLVRQVTSIPMFISPDPFPSRSCIDDNAKKWGFLKFNDWQTIRKNFYLSLSESCELLDAVFLPQPEDTIVDHLFSKPSFSEGSVRLSSGFVNAHPDSDYIHMNKEYGKKVLISAFNIIEKRIFD